MAIKTIKEAAGDSGQEESSREVTFGRFSEEAKSAKQALMEAREAEVHRSQIGTPLVFTDASGDMHPLWPASFQRQELWRQLRGIGAIGNPTVFRNASIIVWLCLNDDTTIQGLSYRTVSTPGVYDPETFDEIEPPTVVRCPLLEEIIKWEDEVYPSDELKLQVIQLSNDIHARIKSAAMGSDGAEDEVEDEDDDEPGKPQNTSGSTKRRSRKSAKAKKKSTGK